MEKYEGINSMINVKRKNFDDFSDDFSQFPPAHKIRRLNVEVPSIVGEENTDFTMKCEQIMPGNTTLEDGVGDRSMPDIEESSTLSLPENEERAIVLFNPTNCPLSSPASRFSVDPNLIASFKSEHSRQALRTVNVRTNDQSEDDEPAYGEYNVVNACRAVIPWAPSQTRSLEPEVLCPQLEVSELDAMDAEEPEAATMEVEDSGGPYVDQQKTDYCRRTTSWQQSHCMFPQPPQNNATPVVWYR